MHITNIVKSMKSVVSDDHCEISNVSQVTTIIELSDAPAYLVDSEFYRSFLGNKDSEDRGCSEKATSTTGNIHVGMA